MTSRSFLMGVGIIAVAVGSGATATILQSCQAQPSGTSSTPAATSLPASPSVSVASSPSPAGTAAQIQTNPNRPEVTPLAANRDPEPSQPTVCVTNQAVVADPNPPLNVRSSPEVQSDNVVGQLKNGTWLSVTAERGGWFEVKSLDQQAIAGWVAKQRTNSSCNRKVSQVNFPTNGDSITVSDRFIGTGTHTYLLQADQGQTMTVSSQTGSLPTIISPDNKVLAEHSNTDQKEWTGQLPLSGKYTLQLESNFKGYEYAFSVQVR